ncbi:MAG: hypothetical protein PHF74_04900 [Dehalococcoidales bacterium]|nr:hypothetical protein [Dehalococcoidales bacterium]
MTLNEIRTLVRRDLRDEDANNYRWNDDEINRHILHAVKDVSEAIPLQQTVIIPTTGGSRELDISGIADRIAIRAVEYPVNRFPKHYHRFSLWENTLTLIDSKIPDGGNACIYYEKAHTIDDSGSSIPAYMEELVICGACGYAAIEWAAFSINRVNTGGKSTPQEFLRWGKTKIDYFRSKLKRMGNKNRVRISRMYQTGSQTAFETTSHMP